MGTGQPNLDWSRNWLLIKTSQFLPNQADIQVILSTHKLIILTKFHNDLIKIVNFSLIAYFWASLVFSPQSHFSVKLKLIKRPFKLRRFQKSISIEILV